MTNTTMTCRLEGHTSPDKWGDSQIEAVPNKTGVSVLRARCARCDEWGSWFIFD